jgi:uncharacterized membrane protein YhaH (DUF805 family)
MDPQAVFDNYKRIITQHYFDMAGRVGRPEFWYFVLANIIATLLAHILGGIVGMPLGALYNLAILLPATSLGARRLQDIGRNGQLVWVLFFLVALSQILTLITVVSFFAVGFFAVTLLPFLTLINIGTLILAAVLIYFWCQPGDPGDNLYGPPPPEFDPARRASPMP